jgi:hypothetical protein
VLVLITLEFQELFCHVKNNGSNFDNLIFFKKNFRRKLNINAYKKS